MSNDNFFKSLNDYFFAKSDMGSPNDILENFTNSQGKKLLDKLKCEYKSKAKIQKLCNKISDSENLAILSHRLVKLSVELEKETSEDKSSNFKVFIKHLEDTKKWDEEKTRIIGKYMAIYKKASLLVEKVLSCSSVNDYFRKMKEDEKNIKDMDDKMTKLIFTPLWQKYFVEGSIPENEIKPRWCTQIFRRIPYQLKLLCDECDWIKREILKKYGTDYLDATIIAKKVVHDDEGIVNLEPKTTYCFSGVDFNSSKDSLEFFDKLGSNNANILKDAELKFKNLMKQVNKKFKNWYYKEIPEEIEKLENEAEEQKMESFRNLLK